LYKAWTLRNADLHDIDTADKEMKQKAKLRPTIVALYETANKIDYMGKRLFDLPLEERLRHSSRELMV
jgi:hypothetical protein